ncbi:zona pellucida-binding protein 1 isoform X4 [Bubalus kerabau]|uniref:zona pellucida-binding protein 1 isoform X4 n=1 Tax=Bubalus carabanensis TaxID=3119969 RepID=UPI00244EF048|nr:zona pellucida-binding protein 1 isoform X4 [Bubalus carabanensis]
MEASAPGRARRGWRRARAAGSPLSRAAVVLVVSALVLWAPPSVGYLDRLPRSAQLPQDAVKIVGSPNIPAYREPHYYYQFTARYHAAPCNSIYNISFEKKLLQILSKLVLDLSCEVSLLKSECHRVKMQRAGLQNELFFTFSVSSLDTEKGPKPCADHSCESSKRLSKAKNLIERFFNQQVEVLGRRAEPLPEIYYIEGTLQMVWINRCFPGYGMNILKHPQCPECCDYLSKMELPFCTELIKYNVTFKSSSYTVIFVYIIRGYHSKNFKEHLLLRSTFTLFCKLKDSVKYSGLLWWLSGEESTCSARDVGLILGLGRFPGEQYGNSL